MEITKQMEKIRKPIKILLILGIFLYPFIHTFIGIDLGDTGYHLYSFENLYKTPELIGFTAYFTTFIGWLWLHIFPGLGLWGLNVLEVILEMFMAFTVYKVLKSYLGEIRTLTGIFLAVIASDTYLNIFNYHQFNVFLLVLILCFQFLAITKENLQFSVLSGICFATVVFSRMGSITAIVTCALYVYWYFIKNKNIKYLVKHIGAFLCGAAAASAGLLLLLKATGQISYFMENILRLFGLASASSGGYSMDNLLSTFVGGNLRSLVAGAIYFGGFFVLILGFGLVFRKGELIKKHIVSVMAGLAALGVALYLFRYAYIVNPVPAWPQMTTAPSFIIGIFYVITFLILCYHLYAQNGKREISLIAIMAIALPLLTIAGSNTGTKHVILGLWIIAPLVTYAMGEFCINENVLNKINQFYSGFGVPISKKTWTFSMGVLIISFLFRYGQMAYYTMNFDSIDRSMINSQIESPKVRFLWTTEREADAVNGVLEEINKIQGKEEYPLIVYGGSIMFYYLTEMDSYVQPWFTNSVYADEKLLSDIETAKEKFDRLPVIIYGRTNNYYGFYEEDYPQRVNETLRNSYGGKRDILLDFLKENDYNLQYVNEYYAIVYPPDIASNEDKTYAGYITGVWE